MTFSFDLGAGNPLSFEDVQKFYSLDTLTDQERSFPIPKKLEAPAIPPPGIAASDAFLGYLQKLRIIGRSGELIIQAPSMLPPLSDEECALFKELKEKKILITNRSNSQTAEVVLDEWVEICTSACLAASYTITTSDVLLVGSQVWKTLPLSYLIRCLTLIGVDPAISASFVLFGLGEHSIPAHADIDTQIQLDHRVDKKDLSHIRNGYIKALANKCGFDSNAVRNDCLEKSKLLDDLLIIGAGSVDTTFSHRRKRLFLTTINGLKRSLYNPTSPPFGDQPYQSIIDFLCGLTRVPEPECVNHLAFPRFLVDRTKWGNVPASAKEEAVVRAIFTGSENQTDALIAIFKNHLPLDPLSAVCYLFNEFCLSDDQRKNEIWKAFLKDNDLAFLHTFQPQARKNEQLAAWIIQCLKKNVPFEEIKIFLSWASFFLLAAPESCTQDGSIEAVLRGTEDYPQMQLTLQNDGRISFLSFPLALDASLRSIKKLFSPQKTRAQKQNFFHSLLHILCPSRPLTALCHQKEGLQKVAPIALFKDSPPGDSPHFHLLFKLASSHLFSSQNEGQIGLLEWIPLLRNQTNSEALGWQKTTLCNLFCHRFPSLSLHEMETFCEDLTNSSFSLKEMVLRFAAMLIRTKNEAVCSTLFNELLATFSHYMLQNEACELFETLLFWMFQEKMRGAFACWKRLEKEIDWTTERKARFAIKVFPLMPKEQKTSPTPILFLSDLCDCIGPLLQPARYQFLSDPAKKNFFIFLADLLSHIPADAPLFAVLAKQIAELPVCPSSSKILPQLKLFLVENRNDAALPLICSLSQTQLTEHDGAIFEESFLTFLSLLKSQEDTRLLLHFFQSWLTCKNSYVFSTNCLQAIIEGALSLSSSMQKKETMSIKVLKKLSEQEKITHLSFSKSFCQLLLIPPLQDIPPNLTRQIQAHFAEILEFFAAPEEAPQLIEWLRRYMELEDTPFPEHIHRPALVALGQSLDHPQWLQMLLNIERKGTRKLELKMELLDQWINQQIDRKSPAYALEGIAQFTHLFPLAPQKFQKSRLNALAIWIQLGLAEEKVDLSLQLIELMRPLQEENIPLYQDCLTRLGITLPAQDPKAAIKFFIDFFQDVLSQTWKQPHPISDLLCQKALTEQEILMLLALYPDPGMSTFKTLLKRAKQSKNGEFKKQIGFSFCLNYRLHGSPDDFSITFKLFSIQDLTEAILRFFSPKEMQLSDDEKSLYITLLNAVTEKARLQKDVPPLLVLHSALDPLRICLALDSYFLKLDGVIFEQILDLDVIQAADFLFRHFPLERNPKRRFQLAINLFATCCRYIHTTPQPDIQKLCCKIQELFTPHEGEDLLPWIFSLSLDHPQIPFTSILFQLGFEKLSDQPDLKENFKSPLAAFIHRLAKSRKIELTALAAKYCQLIMTIDQVPDQESASVLANIAVTYLNHARTQMRQGLDYRSQARVEIDKFLVILPIITLAPNLFRETAAAACNLMDDLFQIAQSETEMQEALQMFTHFVHQFGTRLFSCIPPAEIDENQFLRGIIEKFHYIMMDQVLALQGKDQLQNGVLSIVHQLIEQLVLNNHLLPKSTSELIYHFTFLFKNEDPKNKDVHFEYAKHLISLGLTKDVFHKAPDKVFQMCLYTKTPAPDNLIGVENAAHHIPRCLRELAEKNLSAGNFIHMLSVVAPYLHSHPYWNEPGPDILFDCCNQFFQIAATSSLKGIEGPIPFVELYTILFKNNPLFINKQDYPLIPNLCANLTDLFFKTFLSSHVWSTWELNPQEIFGHFASFLEHAEGSLYKGFYDHYLGRVADLGNLILKNCQSPDTTDTFIATMMHLTYLNHQIADLGPNFQHPPIDYCNSVAFTFFKALRETTGESIEMHLFRYIKPISTEACETLRLRLRSNGRKQNQYPRKR